MSLPLQPQPSSSEEALNPTTSPERLTELSANPHLRPLVASNPNTPWRTLENLAWEFPHAFLHNPVGPLQILANPKQITTEGAFWDALLREASVPPWWWNWLLNHPALSSRNVVRLHVHSAGEAPHPYGLPRSGAERDLLALVEFLTETSASISLPSLPPANKLASSPLISGEQAICAHLQWLAHSADAIVRTAAAKHLLTPPETLQTLALDQDAFVRRAVAANKLTPPETLQALALDQDPFARSAVAANNQTPLEALQILALDQHVIVRKAVARNQRTPVETLQALALDQEAELRQVVTWNKQTPMPVLQILAHDPDKRVRQAVATHQQTPVQILQTLAHDPDLQVRWSMATNKHTPEAILRILALDPGVQEAVAKHPQTPVQILQTLARDDDKNVRVAVAANKQTPGETLQMLAHDPYPYVRRCVARNTQTPAQTLLLLALDPDRDVLQSIAANSQTPIEALRTLAHNPDQYVRAAVARHPQTPVEVLRILAQDHVPDVRQVVARNKQLPIETLHTLALDSAWEVRAAVARHPQAPVEILRILTRDPDPVVDCLASLILKLLVEIKSPSLEEGWRAKLLLLLIDEHGIDQTLSTPIEEQLNEVASLDLPGPAREIILAALTTNWFTARVRSAFSADEFPDAPRVNDIPEGAANYERVMAPFMPPIALQALAASPHWEVRYLIALHTRTPLETRQLLTQDGNRYVRAAARISIIDACV